jgi:Fur family transcriptional regulator, ferric uptake regulator
MIPISESKMPEQVPAGVPEQVPEPVSVHGIGRFGQEGGTVRLVTTQQPTRQPASQQPLRQPASRTPRARGTRQAQAIAAALASMPGFSSAQEIHAELRRRGERVGLTTVYRHLQALSDSGDVDAVHDNGEILYRQCETTAHHHHLRCRSCGRSVEVEGKAVEQWAEKVAAEAGYTEVGHTVELFGLCPDCGASS